MASTSFSPGTVITSVWLNDVNAAVYNTIPTLAPLINPSFTTPALGVATATSINKNYFTSPATNCTWTLADGKSFNVNNTLTLSGTDGASLSLGSGSNSFSGTFSGTSSGTNTGDQLTFKSVKVSGQSDVVARNTADSLTLAAAAGVTLTTDASTDTVTIGAAASVVLLSQLTVSTSVSTINFLNVFSSAYDKYIIELSNLRSSSTTTVDSFNVRLARNGVIDTAATYGMSGPSTSTGGTSVGLSNTSYFFANNILSGTLTIRDANISYSKSIDFRGLGYNGISNNQTIVYDVLGIYANNNPVSGFMMYYTTGAFTAGTVRVYGVKNS